jgi:NitT/TauT family transport system substrate-binding protein
MLIRNNFEEKLVKPWNRTRFATTFIACLLILLACSPKTNKPLEFVRVGYLPSLAASPMYAAIAQGYFKEEGLEVKIQEIFSGPELINALQAKAVDVAFAIVPPLVLARSKDVAVKSIVGATIDSAQVREHRLMLAPDSTVKNTSDLKGKKIAVVAEGTSDYFGLLQYLAKHGLTIADVQIIKTPHPEMMFAIASKAVDAACGIEPFITIGQLQGKIKPFDYYYPDEPTEVGTYIAHEDLIKAKPDVVKRFANAIRKGNAFCRDQAKLRALLPNLEQYGVKFKLTPEAAKVVTIMEFRDALTVKGVESIMNQLVKYGNLSKPIDVKQCIYTTD